MGRFRATPRPRHAGPFGRFRQRVRQGLRPRLRAGDRQAQRRRAVIMIVRRLLLVTPALALVASCGPPPPAVVDLVVKASPDLNRNQAGTPLSVAVRLYSLND